MSAADPHVMPGDATPQSEADGNPASSPNRSRWLRIAAWVALAAYVALMLTLTHLPKPPGVFDKQPDKPVHFVGYFALGALAYATVALTFPTRTGVSLVVVLAGLVFAAIDESTQPMFGRHSDLMDWRADAFGLIVGVIIMGGTRFIFRWRGRRPR